MHATTRRHALKAGLAGAALARERQNKTLDDLLTVPMPRSTLLGWKWLGSVLHGWVFAALFAGVVLLGLAVRRLAVEIDVIAEAADGTVHAHAALRDKAARLIRREPDPTIMRIVEGWPRNFNPQRARGLGFRADKDFEEIIRIHIEDEMQKSPAPRASRA